MNPDVYSRIQFFHQSVLILLPFEQSASLKLYPNQGWDAAGAKDNQDDKNYLNWALALIRDLFFPGKKPKEIIEQGGDDSIKDDLDSGGKKDEGDVKVIFVYFH